MTRLQGFWSAWAYDMIRICLSKQLLTLIKTIILEKGTTLIKRMLTGLCLLALSSGSQSSSIQSDVDALITRVNPNVNLGIVVIDLTSGETLYRRNADRFYIPASNMKLFSEAAAIMVLGPDYHFTNQLSISSGKVQQGVLHGDIYLKLSGDPSFSRDDLKE